MTTRNIVDYLGNVVGTLELPDGTSEDTWTNKLAPYAKAPSVSMEMLATSLVITKEYAVQGTTDWEDVGGITTNPLFFDTDSDMVFGLVTGSYMTDGSGAQLTLSEEFDGEDAHQLRDPALDLDNTDGAWVTFQFATNVHIDTRNLNRAFMLRAKKNSVATMYIRFTLFSSRM